MYTLRLTPAHNRVELSFSGHMMQDAEGLFTELTEAALRVRGNSGDWDVLADYSDTPVLPQDRAQNTARILGWCLAHGIRRIAVVSRSVTQTMQLQRLARQNPVVQIFEQRSHAIDWLERETAA